MVTQSPPPNLVSSQSSTQSAPSPLTQSVDAAKQRDAWKMRAGAVLKRKKARTPFEDRLGQNSDRSVEICRWARDQWTRYRSGLNSWYTRRRHCLNEMNDLFDHRITGQQADREEKKLAFTLSNESLNIVAAMAEFASAQAEQDIFGGDPWFAAKPVGRADHALSDLLQKHLTWKLRDGRLASSWCKGIMLSAFCGEFFSKATYVQSLDEYEEAMTVLMSGGKPVVVQGQMIPDSTPLNDAQAMAAAAGAKGPFSWGEVYQSRSVVTKNGPESVIMNHCDVAFREDATELCLEQTNFYHLTEMTVARARKLFRLSKRDAIRLALAAGWQQGKVWEPGREDHIVDANPHNDDEQTFGMDNEAQLLNGRVQLVEGWVRMDPFGDGVERSLYIVFAPMHEDWLIFADYLGNISPKATLPVFCHPWEQKSGRLYGKGFIEKYGSYQTYVDNLWNQVSFRNGMHANPITGYKPSKFRRDEDDADLRLEPGMMLELNADADLKDGLQFAELPDLDTRSMELMQTAIQIMQLRSGITSASQGDMTGLPQNNTATGIRQLMSRAAVLLKKPVRNVRRSLQAEFSLQTKLVYANMDAAETFLVGEGENVELLTMSPEKIRDLDIDVTMLLTQEQNQTKFESSQAAITAFTTWMTVPEIEKGNARILFLQALKALEFDQVEDIIREAAPTLMDAISLLPEAEQAQALEVMQAGMAALEAQAADVAPPAVPAAPSE